MPEKAFANFAKKNVFLNIILLALPKNFPLRLFCQKKLSINLFCQKIKLILQKSFSIKLISPKNKVPWKKQPVANKMISWMKSQDQLYEANSYVIFNYARSICNHQSWSSKLNTIRFTWWTVSLIHIFFFYSKISSITLDSYNWGSNAINIILFHNQLFWLMLRFYCVELIWLNG